MILISQVGFSQDPAEAAFNEVWQKLGPGLERYYVGDPVGYAELYNREECSYWSGARLVSGYDNLVDYFNQFAGKTVYPDHSISEIKKSLHENTLLLLYTIDEGNGTIWRSTEVWRKTGSWSLIHANWTAIEENSFSLSFYQSLFAGIILLGLGIFTSRLIWRKRK